MTTKKLYFTIQLRIYPFDLIVSMGYSNDEIKYLLEKEGWLQEDIDEIYFDNEVDVGKALLTKNNRAIIRLKYIPITPPEFGDLSHEIFHITTFILDRVGMKFKIGTSDEAYAYLNGYISGEIFKKLKVK